MTLDETIVYCEEIADRCDVTDGDAICANKYRQHAQWLKEYKKLKMKQENSMENIEWVRTVKAWTPDKTPERKPCDDAVSREAMLEIQEKYAEYIGATKFWQMRDDIKASPPVIPQPKIAHWEPIVARGQKFYRCSNCFSECCYVPTAFCPDCGYKMVEEKKSCSNCKFWCLDENDENRRCRYCFHQDEWQAEKSRGE